AACRLYTPSLHDALPISELTNNGLSDWWVIKLNSAGEIQWQKLLGGEGSDIPGQIRETVDGGYILAGIIDDSQNTGTLTGLTSRSEEHTSELQSRENLVC